MSRCTPERLESMRDVLHSRLLRAWRAMRAGARLLCGVPDYDTYVAHLRRLHPERPIPSYAEFFTERQNARYGSGRSRCC
jgi:uncharacterized short protein YbdD (DUF466 family)